MAQGKQAKILKDGQINAALLSIDSRRYPLRDRVIFLLSIKAGLRAKEIAALTWAMVTCAEGKVSDTIHLPDIASKGRSGRSIPLHKQLRETLITLQAEQSQQCVIEPCDPVVTSERGGKMRANSIVMLFQDIFKRLGFDGCSSHSGRRTFITRGAKKISEAGGSIRDIQQLAGHASLQITQKYVEGDSEAKRKLINLI